MLAKREVFEFKPSSAMPDINLVFTGCRTGADCYAFDVIDFNQRRIDRWEVPFLRNEKWLKEIRAKMYPDFLPLGYEDAAQYCDDHYMTPHTVQLAPKGRLFATFGVSESGFGIVTIDTNTGEYEFLDSGDDVPKLFVATGDFDPTFRNFYFATWPMTNTPRDAAKNIPNSIEIEALTTDTLERRQLYTATDKLAGEHVVDTGLPRSLHQVTMSADHRYLICAPFDGVQLVPLPDDTTDGVLTTSKRRFKQLMVLENIITIDLQESKHWFTKIPVPVPAHIEFDLLKPHVFYASAHNIAGSTVGTVLEGNATLFRLEISDGKTEIVGEYTDPRLFRITQHSLFMHDGRVLVALTCVPNRLVILDAETMELWRDVELFSAKPIELSENGAVSPETAFTVYSLNPTDDGRYIVLENASDFIVYDMLEDRVLDVRINRCIPKGYRGRGHTRTAGQ